MPGQVASYSAFPQITEIITTLDGWLDPGQFHDAQPNGLQVPGATTVTHVATAVSAQREVSERAVAIGAELVLVHHGLFWDFHPTGLTPLLAERLRPLFKHDVALASYHLPLDAHPRLGNNAILARELGVVEPAPFAVHKGAPIGFHGRFEAPLARADLLARVARVTEREPLLLGAGPEQVETIGIVSGSAAGFFGEAIELGLDAFLTGEPKEHVTPEAREAGIHFIAAGHHATETFGVRALGDALAERFGIEHTYLDIPNPV